MPSKLPQICEDCSQLGCVARICLLDKVTREKDANLSSMGVSTSREVTFTHFFKPNDSRPGQVRFLHVSFA